MDAPWNKLVEDLKRFPGTELRLEDASPWDGGAFVRLSLAPGEVFESQRLRVKITSDAKGTAVDVVDHEGLAEGVVDALAETRAAVACGTGPLFVRSAILRLCHELYVDLSMQQSAALAALGRTEPEASGQVAPAAEPLLRHASRATEGGMSSLSFESLAEGCSPEMEEDDETVEWEQTVEPTRESTPPKRGGTAGLADQSPDVKEVLVWSTAMDSLKRFPGDFLELESSGCWDGREGLVELKLKAPEQFEWEQLHLMVIVSKSRSTSVQLKGAQVVPGVVAAAVSELNRGGTLGTGPESLGWTLSALCEALCLDMNDNQRNLLEALGNRPKSAGLLLRSELEATGSDSELHSEMMAVEALKMQLGFIQHQISHLENRLACSACIAPELQHELGRLRRSAEEVAAEKAAAAVAVEAALLELTDTGTKGKGASVARVSVQIRDEPSQSLRGHGPEGAAKLLREALQHSGPWGHYAAFQFQSMLSREQELHSDFVSFYHSYSYAALLYEVHAEVARRLFGFAADSAPLPRLSLASAGMCSNLDSLRRKGGSDHDPSFRALGLSCSCSVFASGSEAPPLTCFQGGYSCTDISFRNLLVDFLSTCWGDRKKGEAMADAVVRVGDSHGLCVNGYKSQATTANRTGTSLTGYMLQVFVHKSIVQRFAYPSQPMGTPIKADILDYITKDQGTANGQARVLFHPDTFLDTSKARLYHYCARPVQSCMNTEVAASRGCLLRDLSSALAPLLDGQPARSIVQRLKLQPR